MKTTGFTRDFLTHAAFLAKAVHRGEHTCPQGFFLIDDSSIQKSPETGSGFQAQVYVNPELRQVWVVMAGTNEWVDMLAWPAIEMGYSPSNPFLSVQYIDDAVCFAETVQNVVEDNENYETYQVNVAGYSLGGTLSEVLGETFGWAGVSIDGSGGREIVASPHYAVMLSERGIAIKGSPGHVAINTDATLVGRFGDHIANTTRYVIPLDEKQHAVTHEDGASSTSWYNSGLESVYSLYNEAARVVKGWNTHNIDFLAQKIEEDYGKKGVMERLIADVDDLVAPSQPSASVAVSPPEAVASVALVSDTDQSSTFWAPTFWEWAGVA